MFKQPVYGPREFFYADIFASRQTGCRSQLGLPGVRDQHAGCVGAYLVEHDLFDFLLLSLPDNDTHSHKHGPDAQVTSLAAADQQIERLMHAAGGPDAFLEDHAVIVCSDHSQSQVDDEIDLFRAFDGFGVLPPSGVRETRAGSAEIAVCPSSRAAQVYVLDREDRAAMVPRVVRTLLALEGVDLVMHFTNHPDGEVAVRSSRGELRFARRGDLSDLRGESWSVEGDLDVLALAVRDGRVTSDRYPDALGRVWSALRLPHRGRGDGVGPTGLGVPRLGSRAPHRRRLARILACQRLARLAPLVRDRARHCGCARAVDAARHRPDGPGPLRVGQLAPGRVTGAAAPAPDRATGAFHVKRFHPA